MSLDSSGHDKPLLFWKDWWQRAGTQLTKHGQTKSCHYDKSVLQSWLLQSHSRGLYSGNSSLPLNLVLPNCFVCFGPRLCIRNDKSSSFILKARQFDCQCQHDKVLMAMGVGGGSKHRGARAKALQLTPGKQEQELLPPVEARAYPTMFFYLLHVALSQNCCSGINYQSDPL